MVAAVLGQVKIKRLILSFLQVSGAMLAVMCGVGLAQQPQPADAHMSCVRKLEIPAYPPLAKMARVENGRSELRSSWVTRARS
jgi:hypothetical protein